MNSINLKRIVAESFAADKDTTEIFETLEETFDRILTENYWPEDDKQNQTELDDTRRPRLTLRHLHKLRMVQELKKLEMMAHKDFVKRMYTEPTEGGGQEY